MSKKDAIVTVIGGSGFLGNYVVQRLAALGFRVNVLSRNAAIRSPQMKVSGAVGQISLINCDANNLKQLEKYISKSTYVVNLIGLAMSRGKQSYANLHTSLPAKLSAMCKRHGVKKLIHISALGVDKVKSAKYATTKLEGEKNILENFKGATILRPGALFGPEDRFLNLYNDFAKYSPVIPMVGTGSTKLQPVYVADVADAVVACIRGNHEGKILELAGPKVYTVKQIAEFVLKTVGKKRGFIYMPFFVMKINAFFMSFLPKPLITVDQVELLKYDNLLTGKNGFDELGIKPTSMETVAPKYLS